VAYEASADTSHQAAHMSEYVTGSHTLDCGLSLRELASGGGFVKRYMSLEVVSEVMFVGW